MKQFQFFLVCTAYILFALISLQKYGDAESVTPPPGMNCSEEKYKVYTEDFFMQMGLCKRNLTVLCAIRPSHPCISDQSRFKVTAFVKGSLGRCLIEGNVTSKKTLRFYVEAKKIKNPNQEGSRSLGADKERHQRGKCMLKYVCSKKKVRSVAMDCGSVFETKTGLENFTRRKAIWNAPKNFKGSVYFSSQVLISADQREFDVSTAKILTADDMDENGKEKDGKKKGKSKTKDSKEGDDEDDD